MPLGGAKDMHLSYFKSSCQIRLIIDQLTVTWSRISRNIERDACKKRNMTSKDIAPKSLCPEKAINKVDLKQELSWPSTWKDSLPWSMKVKRCSFLPYFPLYILQSEPSKTNSNNMICTFRQKNMTYNIGLPLWVVD